MEFISTNINHIYLLYILNVQQVSLLHNCSKRRYIATFAAILCIPNIPRPLFRSIIILTMEHEKIAHGAKTDSETFA